MLEFIVLGKVPGTGVQLSFIGILLLAIAGVLVMRSLRSYYRFHKFTNGFGQAARYFVLTSKKTAKAK